MPTIKNWDPSSDFGEDGLPNRDKANYPFWIITLGEFVDNEYYKDVRNQKILSGPSNRPEGRMYVDVFRLYPPDGYVSLGDIVSAYYPSDGDKRYKPWEVYGNALSQTQRRQQLVFVKQSAGPNKEPYAKQVFLGNIVNPTYPDCNSNDFNASYSRSWGKDTYWGFNIYRERIGYVRDGKLMRLPRKDDYENAQSSSVFMWRGNDLDGGRYLCLSNSFQYNSHDWSISSPGNRNVWAVRSDLAMNLKESDLDINESILQTPIIDNPSAGRLILDSIDWGSGLNFAFYSTLMIFNRKRLDNSIIPPNQPGRRTFLPAFDGVICERAGKQNWAGVTTSGGWNFDSNEFLRFKYYLRFYMLIPYNSKNYCCLTNQSSQSTITECGWGPFLTNPQSAVCQDFGRELCRADNPNMLTSSYCLDTVCKTSPSDDKPLNCDAEFKELCKIKLDGKYYYYDRYPDICSCFMPDDFLKTACDDMATQLGIKNNPAGMKVLNIDTTDPDQCNQNSCLNPMCGKTAVITTTSHKKTFPRAFEAGINRDGKPVIKGATTDRSKCEDRNVCIQSVTINNEGKIGELNINQQIASCGGYKDKRCQRSTFSRCEIHKGNGLFVKKLEKELDKGLCGTVGDEVECAQFTTTPIFDECNNGIRTTVFRQTKYNYDEADVLDALKVYMPQDIKDNRGSAYFDAKDNYGFYMSQCANCEMGYEGKGDCFLDGNVWKQELTKTKVLNQKKNLGKDCEASSEKVVLGCQLDKDCKVSIKTNDSGCQNNIREIEYKIDSLNSKNGKTCRDAILDSLPKIFKDNFPSVRFAPDKLTAKAQIPCRDCEIGYTIDRTHNGGKCFYDESRQKWFIKKKPYLKHSASGGGQCQREKLDILDKNIQIEEECEANQDCKFSQYPKINVCDEDLGEQTIVYEVEKMRNNKGMSCEDASIKLGQKYSLNEENIVYDDERKEVTIKTACTKNEDCEVDFYMSLGEVCDESNGIGVEIYPVNKQRRGNGKTCSEVATENLKGRLGEMTAIQEGNKVFVYKKCSKLKEGITKKIIYVAIGLTILFSLLALLL